MAITARFTNAWQSCVNAKRFIVEEAIADRFAEAMRAGAETLHMGDPADPATTLGPLARAKIGRAHVGTPVTNAHLVCSLLLEKKKTNTHTDDKPTQQTLTDTITHI